jgi:hypothetical protein
MQDLSSPSRRVVRLFHCTTVSNAAAIKSNGFKCGSRGIAGGGIYFAWSLEDAARKSHHSGVVLECEVDIGRVHYAGFMGDPSLNLERLKESGYDSVLIPRNGDPGTEFCVYKPSRVRVVGEWPDPVDPQSKHAPDKAERSAWSALKAKLSRRQSRPEEDQIASIRSGMCRGCNGVGSVCSNSSGICGGEHGVSCYVANGCVLGYCIAGYGCSVRRCQTCNGTGR